MRHPRNSDLLQNARTLRKNMTKEERHLWFDFLRYCRPRFRRQEIIGNYIADFYCHEARLVVELDGSQHLEPEQISYDRRRTSYFQAQGIQVLRYYNTDINKNFEGVCNHIAEALKSQGLHPKLTFGEEEL